MALILSSVECENGPISWTEYNIMVEFCMHIDIDRM